MSQLITFTAAVHTVSLFIKGTSTSTQVALGLFSGSFLASSGQILSGPGAISGSGLMSVTGLSTTQWTRIAITTTAATPAAAIPLLIYPGGGNVAGAANVIWGVQVEAGNFATSYIPTVATTVQRTADLAVISGSNFTPWFNQNEGTLVSEIFRSDASGGSRGAWSINGGTTANGMDYRPYGSNNVVVVGGVGQVDIYPGGGSANSVVKNAFAFKANDFASSTNGGAVVTDTSGTLPVVTRIVIGGLSSDLFQVLCGHVRNIRYYPLRFANATLPALSA
jgi:hypothetical protein